MATVALIATVIAARPLFNPRSMVAAILGTEVVGLADTTNRERLGLPSWNTIQGKYERQRDAHPLGSAYGASKTLVHSLVHLDTYVHGENGFLVRYRAGQSEPAVFDTGEWIERDPSNLLSRLAWALILDDKLSQSDASAAERVRRIADAVRVDPATNRCTSYDPIFRDVLEREVAPIVHRSDVAAAIATEYYYSPLSNYDESVAVLTMMVERIAALRDAVAADETEKDATSLAAHCNGWIVGLCIGVMDSEREPGIQCLAADLLARYGSDDSAATVLQRFLKAHTVDVPNVGADRAAPMLSWPSVAQAEYERAFESLALLALSIALAIGAGVSLVVTVGYSLTSLNNRPAGATTWTDRVATIGFIALSIVPIRIASNVYGNGTPFYSENLAAAVVHAAVTFAACLPILMVAILCGLRSGEAAKYLARCALAGLLIVVALVVILSPAVSATRWLRGLHYDTSNLIWSALGTFFVVIAAVFVARLPGRRLARSATVVWLVFALFAVAILQWHHSADGAYQRAAVSAYRDPVAARLGSDWKKTYLEPVRRAYEPLLK